MDLAGRYRGALLGLAAGDALGTTLEFARPGSFRLITDMVGGGPFSLAPGQWTDDTSMALCLAERLLECNGFDPVDQLTRYCRWWRTGHLSSTGSASTSGRRSGRPWRRSRRPGIPIRLGDDADTTGAVHGQLAGAYYGVQGIPEAWRAKLVQRDLIIQDADDLLRLSPNEAGQPQNTQSTRGNPV